MSIRICPERDAACPHGLACPYVGDRYTCAAGWHSPPVDIGLSEKASGADIARTEPRSSVLTSTQCQSEWKDTAKVLINDLADERDYTLRLRAELTSAREYVTDALDAHEHSDGRELLQRIDAALAVDAVRISERRSSEGLSVAARALNDACDAFWNDLNKVVQGRINDQHVWAITHAQEMLQLALSSGVPTPAVAGAEQSEAPCAGKEALDEPLPPQPTEATTEALRKGLERATDIMGAAARRLERLGQDESVRALNEEIADARALLTQTGEGS